MHDCASRKRGPMTAVPPLIALESPAVDEPMYVAVLSWNGTHRAIAPSPIRSHMFLDSAEHLYGRRLQPRNLMTLHIMSGIVILVLSIILGRRLLSRLGNQDKLLP